MQRIDNLRPQLELRDLELVLALARARSTAAAASALHITQSAVSRALGQAEGRVGVRLFERSARGLFPTTAGQRLISGASAILLQVCELERSVSLGAAEPAHVRLVCECYTAYRWLPSAMAELRRRMPELEVEVVTDHTHDPVGALLRKELDVALLTTADVPKGKGLVEQPLFSDEVVFVASAHHALARLPTLTREALRSTTLITGHTAAAEGRWFLRAAFGRRPPMLKFLRFPLTEAIMDAARAGMGIAVLSEWVASGYLEAGDLVLKRLATGPLRRPWRMAYRREATLSVERLLSVLIAAAPHLP